ncbi:MAG: alpha/beta hydrolase fold domain-containing protein, partial [Novosphingobium meiothermophilum]
PALALALAIHELSTNASIFGALSAPVGRVLVVWSLRYQAESMLTLRLRDEGGPALAHQLLIYPVTDADFTRPSYAENGGGNYFLSTQMMQWFWNHYVGDCGNPHPLAAVLRAHDLSGLPPATVIVAEYDPLRDEGLAYADALAAAGTPVDCMTAPGMIHGFFSMFEAVPDALVWIERAGARLKAALAA